MDSHLVLNPKYIKSGFASQALTIARFQKANIRKVACLIEVIATHILKYGNDCYASTNRLLTIYNIRCSSYGCRPIKERSLYKLLNEAQERDLIVRSSKYDPTTGISKRHISLNLPTIKIMFVSAYKYALQAATKLVNRQNLQSGGGDGHNSHKPLSGKASQRLGNFQKCSKNDQSISKEINKNKGLPSDQFFLKWFGSDANKVKSLQLAAKEGKITASGAKALIHQYAVCGFDMPTRFKKYLSWIISKAHRANKLQESIEVAAFGGMPEQAKQQANALILEINEPDIAMGRLTVSFDRQGRVVLSEPLNLA